MIFFISAAVSCSDKEDIPTSGPRIPIEQVPSGEVIRVENREEALVGYSEDGTNELEQIWWQHEVKTISYDCPAQYEEGDNSETSMETLVAFKNDGNLYKINEEGEEEVFASWSWINDYSGIYINGVPYQFTALNENEVVYYNFTGSDECNTLIWEQMVK